MSGLDGYLRRATRGLPRHERQRVQEELRGSLLERACELQIQGLSQDESLTLALREFGQPAPLAAGMRRIHLWPRVGALTVLSSTLLIAGWLMSPRGSAQPVEITTQGLNPTCDQVKPRSDAACVSQRQLWVSLISLNRQLEDQGVTVQPADASRFDPYLDRGSEDGLILTWRESDGLQAKVLLPTTNRGEASTVDALQKMDRALPSGQGRSFRPFLAERVFKRGEDTYLQAQMLLSAAGETANMPVTLSRPLDGPVVRIGRLRLELGQPGQGAQVAALVRQIVGAWLWQWQGVNVYTGGHLLPQVDDLYPPAAPITYPQRIKVRGRPGELYAVLRPVTGGGVSGLSLDLATVNDRGLLTFRTLQPQVRYTLDWQALSRSGPEKAAVTLLRLGDSIRLSAQLQQPFRPELP